MTRALPEIIADDRTSWQKSEECLWSLNELPQDDLARPDYRAAAITFAIFALIEQLQDSPR